MSRRVVYKSCRRGVKECGGFEGEVDSEEERARGDE